jgi:hypothetical protein
VSDWIDEIFQVSEAIRDYEDRMSPELRAYVQENQTLQNYWAQELECAIGKEVLRVGIVTFDVKPYLPTLDAYVSRVILDKKTHAAHLYIHGDDSCSMRDAVTFMTAIDPQVDRITVTCPPDVWSRVFYKLSDGSWEAVFRRRRRPLLVRDAPAVKGTGTE